MRNSLFAAAFISLAIFFFPSPARALGPVDVEVAAKVGYAANPDSPSPNPLGLGLGGRAGVSIFGVYAGINVLYHFGETNTAAGALISASASSLLYGIEAGYGISLADILTLRAQLGVGNISESWKGTVGSVMVSRPSSVNNLYLEPGITGLVGWGSYFVGADANILILPSIEQRSSGQTTTETSFTLHGQVGVKF